MADGMPAVGFCEYLMEREKMEDVQGNGNLDCETYVTNIFADAMAPGKLRTKEHRELDASMMHANT
jgi:hypothetical protein